MNYTRKAVALVSDPAVVKRVGRSLHPKALFPSESPADIRVQAEAIRESVSKHALKYVAMNPALAVAGTSPSTEDARAMWEDWRTHQYETLDSFNALDPATQAALARSLRSAETAVREVTSLEEQEKAARKAAADRDRHVLTALSRYRRAESSGVDVSGDTKRKELIPEDDLADALCASMGFPPYKEDIAMKQWALSVGIDPDDVHLFGGKVVPRKSGDPSKERKVKQHIKGAWNGKGAAPTGAALYQRLVDNRDRRVDDALDLEFSKATKRELAEVRDKRVQAAREKIDSVAYAAWSGRKLTRAQLLANTGFVGSGDAKLAGKLLSGKASDDDLAVEMERLNALPARHRNTESENALTAVASQKILEEAGVHPRNLDASELPPEATKRIKNVLRDRIVALGEDFYAEDPLEDDVMRLPLKKRAQYVVDNGLSLLNGRRGDHLDSVKWDIDYLVNEILVTQGRKLRAKQDTVKPFDTMDPLF